MWAAYVLIAIGGIWVILKIIDVVLTNQRRKDCIKKGLLPEDFKKEKKKESKT